MDSGQTDMTSPTCVCFMQIMQKMHSKQCWLVIILLLRDFGSYVVIYMNVCIKFHIFSSIDSLLLASRFHAGKIPLTEQKFS
jgi:hypothetical protein